MGQLTCLPSPASAHQPACLPASASLQRAMSIPADLRSYRTDFINRLLAGNFKVGCSRLASVLDGWFVCGRVGTGRISCQCGDQKELAQR